MENIDASSPLQMRQHYMNTKQHEHSYELAGVSALASGALDIVGNNGAKVLDSEQCLVKEQTLM